MTLDELHKLAGHYFSDQRYEEAIPLYETLVSHPEYYRMLSNLGYCYQLTGRHLQAISAWTNAHLQPTPKHVQRALPFSYGQLQDWANMKKHAMLAIEASERADDYLLQQLAIAAYYLNEYEIACKAALDGLVHGHNDYCLYYAALSFSQLGDTMQAGRYLLMLLWSNTRFLENIEKAEYDRLAGAAPEIVRALPLLHAIKSGTLVNIDEVNADVISDTPWIHFAAEAGHLQVLEALLKRGAFVDATNHKGETALIKAVEQKHLPAIELLTKFGADPYIKTSYGHSAYSIALKSLPQARATFLRSGIKRQETMYIPSALKPFEAAIKSTARKAILIEAFDEPMSLQYTFFSESPTINSPLCETCREPYNLLWQIDFSEINDADFREGIWQVFGHFRCGDDSSPQFKFSWYAGKSEDHMKPHSQALSWVKYAHATPVLNVPSAHSRECAIYENRNDFSADKGRERLWAAYNFTEDFFIEKSIISRIGGYPPWIQSEEEVPMCERCGKSKSFIAALGSDDTNILFGDSGYFYFFACREHEDGLKDCTAMHQCY